MKFSSEGAFSVFFLNPKARFEIWKSVEYFIKNAGNYECSFKNYLTLFWHRGPPNHCSVCSIFRCFRAPAVARYSYWLKARCSGICSKVFATPVGQMGLEMGWFPLGNGACLIMKKVPSDSPICQLKKRQLLLPISFLITKPLKLDLSNLHYTPHYKPHYRTQGCLIR